MFDERGFSPENPYFTSIDYYETLGVSPNASKKEISRAFKRQSLKCHPDLFPGDQAAKERFILLN